MAAPTVAASIDPESNEWIPYRSEVVAFDAMIPPAFDIEEVPDDDGNPGGSVYLSSDPERSQGLYVLIGVFAIPIAEETKGEPISQFSLGFNVKEDLIDQGATIISGPQLIEIAGAPGVHFIVDLPQDASGIDARSYKATISNGTWLHNIEVIGPIEDEETIQAYYESFIASFVPHDSSTVPLATPGRPPRPPRR